jgi:alpha-L-fucosidase
MSISRRKFLKTSAAVAAAGLAGPLWRPSGALAQERPPEDLERARVTAAVVAGPIETGPVEPNEASIKAIRCPEWFRDAKFGIWSHWGPGCISGVDQNYAREMYRQGSWAYKYHVAHFGDPAKVGYKDILKYWTASQWNPEGLMKKYKAAGARYFVSMGRHHDGVDCYDSQYTPWNSVNIGPKKDVGGIWQQAARHEGMRFGFSFHPHDFYYWEGQKQNKIPVVYDTSDPKYWSLYVPPPGTPGADKEFKDGVYARIKDAIDKYHPDLLYFDGGIPDPEVRGDKLMAHFYNSNIKQHDGHNEAVLCLKSDQGGVKDLERGQMKDITEQPWQCDTSESSWFYLDEAAADDELYTIHKSSATMLQALADIVSKNGNLLMNIPQRADGSIDEHCEVLLADFAAWMKINSESIFETRPWVIYGEGPTELPRSNLNDLKTPMTSKDFRFTTHGHTLYAIMCGWPVSGQAMIKSLASDSKYAPGEIKGLQLLGCDQKLEWTRTPEGLQIKLPSKRPCDLAYVFKMTL